MPAAGAGLLAGFIGYLFLDFLSAVHDDVQPGIERAQAVGECRHADQAAGHGAAEHADVPAAAAEHTAISLVHPLRDSTMLPLAADGKAPVHLVGRIFHKLDLVQKRISACTEYARFFSAAEGCDQLFVFVLIPSGTAAVTAVMADIERLVPARSLCVRPGLRDEVVGAGVEAGDGRILVNHTGELRIRIVLVVHLRVRDHFCGAYRCHRRSSQCADNQ